MTTCMWCGDLLIPIDEPRFDAPGSDRVWYHSDIRDRLLARCVDDDDNVRTGTPGFVIVEEP